MPRTVTAALQAELDKAITRIGYLCAFSTSPPFNICDVGTVNWNGKVYVEYDVRISGLGDGSAQPRLSLQNMDNAAAALFTSADMSEVVCDVWQVAPAAVATAADVVRLGRFMLGACDIELRTLSFPLIPENALDAYAPRRRVDIANGFFHALPKGTKINWENETYITEPHDG